MTVSAKHPRARPNVRIAQGYNACTHHRVLDLGQRILANLGA